MSNPHVHRGSSSFGIAVAMAGGVLAWHKLSTDPPVAVVAAAIESLRAGAACDTANAMTALSRHPQLAFAALLDEMDEDDAFDRTGVLAALARLPDERALPVVRQFAAKHSLPAIRRAAVAAVGAVQDVASLPMLRTLADRDPVLVVRQQAIVSIAEIGDDAMVADLAALLDPTTLPDLTAAARRLLRALTDREFTAAVDAREWLARHLDAHPKTSVGGVGPGESSDVERDSVRVSMRQDRAEITIGAEVAMPLNLILRLDHGVLLVEVAEEDGVVLARCRDLPEVGGDLIRHAPVQVEQQGGALAFSIPRVGQLAQCRLFDLAVISAACNQELPAIHSGDLRSSAE